LAAVSVDRASKRFVISRRRETGLKERALSAIKHGRLEREVLWALRKVSLQVERGETFGIIGPNGCGKSTLLQLIAGILVPDEGVVRAAGRVTSLLELGAGFSPELTGRENIFLNASLHGVSREATARLFDAIVAFAELDRFIDMPVRTYSSGMYVRLGFAVAVHLDPDIVLVDEAFAVGDERFQRKCLQKIRAFQEEGRTLLLVSHDLALIEQLCKRAALLNQGELVAEGAAPDVIGRYHSLSLDRGSAEVGGRWGTGEVEITGLELLSDGTPVRTTLRTREPLTVRLHYRCVNAVEGAVFGLAIYHEDGAHLTGPNTRTGGFELGRIHGEGTIDYTVDRLPLLPGRYYVSAAVYDRDLITPFDHRDKCASLVVVEGGSPERFGMVEFPARWSIPAPLVSSRKEQRR
jgi:ABC-type polysaccharide/polyol phosphate transport system ATPase subunit